MAALALRIGKWLLTILAIFLIAFLGVRIYIAQQGLPLEVWHTYAPDELSAEQMDASDWEGYLAAESRIFQALQENVTRKLPPEEKVPFNRYFEGSPVYPGRFLTDWNRSYILEPQASQPAGAVVLLHGLTDSPYSLRHIASLYRDRGFVVVAIRLPAHGTTPAALTKIHWPDWLAAARLAVREARRRAPEPAPLHIVGFSNGGTIALKYVLDASEDASLSRISRLILISPMVGVTSVARFAGLAGLPAILPAFAKAAWLSVLPEFNPFKYNSFPVNGARQSYLLTEALQARIASQAGRGLLADLPPVLTFQSVMDFTVSTPAVLSGLYDFLPKNSSELVLFDLNRNAKFGPLLRENADTKLSRILPSAARNYKVSIVTNAGDGADETVERVIAAGGVAEETHRLGLAYPKGVFSLSHVALPFPLSDSLYGLMPDEPDDFGVHLGSLDLRGERGTLLVSLDSLSRMSSNPFFPYLAEKVDALLSNRVKPVSSGGEPRKSVSTDSSPPAPAISTEERAQSEKRKSTRVTKRRRGR